MKKIVCGILAGCLVLATATGCQKNASGKTPITLNEVAHSMRPSTPPLSWDILMKRDWT